MKANLNKKIIHLIIISCFLFLSMIVYLTYFQLFVGARIVENPYNKRQWAREDNTIRGFIYDRNGVELATSEVVEGVPLRRYPHGKIYSHVIGYNSKVYGRYGIENYYNETLMAITDNPITKIREHLSGDMVKGNHLTLTIDHELQKLGERLLNGKKGSIVAINPSTGEVLAMISKPDFNPSDLGGQWDGLITDERSPLLNRSLAGLYPPGSTYKVIIASGVLENMDSIDTNYECTGSIVIDGYELSDSNKQGHGPVDLRRSIVESCNTNFARMAIALGASKVVNISDRYFVGRSINSDMPLRQSRIPKTNEIIPTELGALGIGQGRLLMTPMHMALIAATIANDGIMVEPYIVQSVQNQNGKVIQRGGGESHRIVSHEIAQELKDMLVEAVNQGTGKNARIQGVRVGGKTGTAQTDAGENHALFIGFAPENNPKIAIAVILENEGASGGQAAAPIAREMLKLALRRGGE